MFLFNISEVEFAILQALISKNRMLTFREIQARIHAALAALGQAKKPSAVYLWRCIHTLEDMGIIRVEGTIPKFIYLNPRFVVSLQTLLLAISNFKKEVADAISKSN